MTDIEFDAIKSEIAAAFTSYRQGTITQVLRDARLAMLQERIRKQRMPNQNFFSGYITGWIAATDGEQ